MTTQDLTFDVFDEIHIARTAIKLAYQNERATFKEVDAISAQYQVENNSPPGYTLSGYQSTPKYVAWRKRWTESQRIESAKYEHLRKILMRLGLEDYQPQGYAYHV